LPGELFKNATPLFQDALDAYVYGYPIVLMETTRRNMQAGALQSNNLLIRLYWPGQAVLIGSWRPPPVLRG
jgi:hypothetical protein